MQFIFGSWVSSRYSAKELHLAAYFDRNVISKDEEDVRLHEYSTKHKSSSVYNFKTRSVANLNCVVLFGERRNSICVDFSEKGKIGFRRVLKCAIYQQKILFICVPRNFLAGRSKKSRLWSRSLRGPPTPSDTLFVSGGERRPPAFCFTAIEITSKVWIWFMYIKVLHIRVVVSTKQWGCFGGGVTFNPPSPKLSLTHFRSQELRHRTDAS